MQQPTININLARNNLNRSNQLQDICKKHPISSLIFLILFLFVISPIGYSNPIEKEKLAISYFRLTPDITTNLNTETTNSLLPVMSIRLELMVNFQSHKELLKHHEPLYRNELILFINKHHVSDLVTPRQKRHFKRSVKKLINSTLYKEIKRPDIVQRVLITRLVTE